MSESKHNIESLVSEENFSGEIRSWFSDDPLRIGFAASGKIEEGILSLRSAAKAAAENAGLPQPTKYSIGVEAADGGFAVRFSLV